MALTVEKLDQRITNQQKKIDVKRRQLLKADEIKSVVPGQLAVLQKKLAYDQERRANLAAGKPVDEAELEDTDTEAIPPAEDEEATEAAQRDENEDEPSFS